MSECYSFVAGQPVVGDDDTVSVDLPSRESIFLDLPSISSLTLFRGRAPREILKARLRDVLEANPWLCGRLVSADGCIRIVYPRRLRTEHVKGIFGVHRQRVCPSMGYNRMLQKLGPACIKWGRRCLDADEPLFRVIICEDKELHSAESSESVGECLLDSNQKLTANSGEDAQNSFGLLVSMSHLIGDGDTYYQIYGMLSQDSEVVPLNDKRLADFDQALRTALGEAEVDWVGSSSFNISAYSSCLLRTARARIFEVAADWVKQRKHEHQESARADNNLPSFVSTNDILTSWFARRCGVDLTFMLVNFRNRLSLNLTSMDAGNYEGFIPYMADDCATSALIRQSLDSFRRASPSKTQLPGVWSAFLSRMCLITNWTTLYRPLRLYDHEQFLHLPIGPFSAAADVMIIFNPAPNRIGIFCVTASISGFELEEAVEKESMGTLLIHA